MIKRDEKARFIRTRKAWTLDNFDDGYIDNRGRFRVYSPNHPRAYSSGYILRSIIAYEAYHGVKVEKGMNIHHIDHNRSNDSKSNLVLISHEEHTSMHKRKPERIKELVCTRCKQKFFLPQYRINSGRGKYCTALCYESRGSK